MPNLDIAFIGAGNVATHLAPALQQAGYGIASVFSRTAASANALAKVVNATATTDLGNVAEADVYFYCVKDDALPTIAERVATLHPHSLHIHTSGSTAMYIFPPACERHGVLYPLQTFTKSTPIDFKEIPCFIEGCNEETEREVADLAKAISHDVRHMDSEQRRYLHLAAVFACNFVNHCYAIAARLLSENVGLTYDILLPLIDETARKVHRLAPEDAQTGPAVRYDTRIIDRQKAMLADSAHWEQLYTLLSESIHDFATHRSPQQPQHAHQ